MAYRATIHGIAKQQQQQPQLIKVTFNRFPFDLFIDYSAPSTS